MNKVICSRGECMVRADSKIAVYALMESFLDELPYTKALSRNVRRLKKDAGFGWEGHMRWERNIPVEKKVA